MMGLLSRGAKTAHPSLFDGDGWATKSALTRCWCTPGAAASVGSQSFYDIDVESDLTRLAADCARSGQGAAMASG